MVEVLQDRLLRSKAAVADIAEIAGVSATTVYHVRNRADIGGYRPQLKTIIGIADAMDYQLVLQPK